MAILGRIHSLWLLILVAGSFIGLVVTQPEIISFMTLGLVLGGAVILLSLLLLRAPEILFALYMSVASFKVMLLPLQTKVGIDITVVLGILVVVGIAIRILRNENQIYLHWPILSGYLLLIGWMYFSLVWSLPEGYGWEKSTRFATLTFLAFLGPMFLLNTWQRLEHFFWVLLLVGILVAALILGNLYFEGKAQRLEFVFGLDYLTISSTCGLGAGLGFYFLISDRIKLWIRLALLVWVGAMLFVLFLSAARGAMVAWPIAFIVPILLNRRKSKKIFSILGVLSVGIVLLGVTWISGWLPYEVTWRFDLILSALLGDPEATLLIAHPYLWWVALNKFLEYPLSGTGVGAYLAFFNTSAGAVKLVYPHNLFLEAGAELGIVGLVLTSFIVIIPVIRWRTCSNIELVNHNRLLFQMAMWIYSFLFILAMKSGDFNHNRQFWMSVGVVMSVSMLVIREARLSIMAKATRRTSGPS